MDAILDRVVRENLSEEVNVSETWKKKNEVTTITMSV